MNLYRPIFVLVISLLLLAPSYPAAQSAAPERSEIDDKYKWNLADIYPNVEDWEADFARVEAMIPELTAFRGRLGESGETLLAFHKKSEEAEYIFEKLIIYAGLSADQDSRVSETKALRDRTRGLGVRYGAAISWAMPELVSIDRERLQGFLDGTDGLKMYQHTYDDLWRQQEHILSEGEEKILSLSGDLASVPRDVQNQLANADLRFGTFLDENGEEVEMTKGRYGVYLQNTDRNVRREAFRVYYDAYEKYVHGNAAALAGAMKRDLFYARARGYETCAEASLDSDNLDVEILENLIATINANMAPVKKYYQIRKRVMDLDTLYHWDTYVPLTPSLDKEVPYEEAVKTISAAVKPLGGTYVEDLQNAFGSGWIDVYENVGKRAGAYSWGGYATPHPYMLMNYQSKLNDMFTLCHELGHSMHTFYTVSAQPQEYADYTLFVAEVASTLNEALLMNHMLGEIEDRETRIYLLNYWIRQILGTVYTQVMFTEFEKTIHEMLEGGEALTTDALNTAYYDLMQKYAGYEVVYPEIAAIGWSRIHHFYRNYYVYKYATSYAAATALSRDILDGKEGALERYLNFLKSGSSDYPNDLLKAAGVDLSTPAPIQATCDLLAELVDELDRLVEEG